MSHERDALSLRPLVIGFSAVGVLLVLGLIVPTLVERALIEKRERMSPPANPLSAEFGRSVPPAPRLQVVPARDLASLRARENRILESYGWVDREQEIVRIPIERAMELLVERGEKSAGASAGGEGATP